jgi:uracil-DNA glycosylase family 4
MPDLAKVLDIVAEEIKDLRRQGITELYLQEETIDALKELIGPLDSLGEAPAPRAAQHSSVEPPAPTGKASTILADFKNEKKAPAARPTTKKPAPSTPSEFPASPSFDLPDTTPEEQWLWLKNKVLSCSVCQSQVKPGKQVVFGVGDINARIMFVGEAPGAEEEVKGEPFVGPAGDLLNKIITAMKLKRQAIYITNAVYFRPSMPTPVGNRPPSPDEIAFCRPYLDAQIDIVKPDVIMGLGLTAVRTLLPEQKNPRMGSIRGKWFSYRSIPTLFTFHPSYLLHNEGLVAKRQVWEDMLKVMEKVDLPISEKQRSFFT